LSTGEDNPRLNDSICELSTDEDKPRLNDSIYELSIGEDKPRFIPCRPHEYFAAARSGYPTEDGAL